MRTRGPHPWAVACGLLLATQAAGCHDHGDTDMDGDPTGSTCPSGSTLTYESFGQAFMEAYCTRCHSSHLTGADRQGAPSDHNLETLEAIRASGLEHIDETSAAGPERINTAMPPDDPRPTEAERRQLGEWLACGAP